MITSTIFHRVSSTESREVFFLINYLLSWKTDFENSMLKKKGMLAVARNDRRAYVKLLNSFSTAARLRFITPMYARAYKNASHGLMEGYWRTRMKNRNSVQSFQLLWMFIDPIDLLTESVSRSFHSFPFLYFQQRYGYSIYGSWLDGKLITMFLVKHSNVKSSKNILCWTESGVLCPKHQWRESFWSLEARNKRKMKGKSWSIQAIWKMHRN